MILGRDEQRVALAAVLDGPGLSVLVGGPGVGKTALARCAAAQAGRPVLQAGALASLRHLPALPLSRAIRAAVPTHDRLLAVEAVRARVGEAVLLLDDAHWADRFTLSLLGELARHCRVLVTVRTPGPLGAGALAALRATARYFADLPGLPDEVAAQVVRQVRADLAEPVVRQVVRRCGGNPLALRVLARAGDQRPDVEPLRGVAEMIADLPQPERTALAALGLLGRPAPAALLGPGGPGLVHHGLAVATGEVIAPAEGFVAEVAAGVLPHDQRQALHRRLAELLDDGEAARHLAAAGDRGQAAQRAERAAAAAEQVGVRAEHLLFAVSCLGDGADLDLVLRAADAALDAGLPVRARHLVEPLPTPASAADRVRRAVVLSEALTRCGEPEPAAAALRRVAADLAGLDTPLRARHAVASVYAALADDPDVACALAAYPLAELGDEAPPRLWAAYGAALLAAGRTGWQDAVRAAVTAARRDGDLAGECAAGAVLVAGLREACQTAEARTLAADLAERAAEQTAYSLEATFRAEELWARLHTDGVDDALLGSAATLLAHAVPPATRALLAAALALAHADSGAIPAARAVLADNGDPDRLTGWVTAELTWLDGDLPGAARLAEAVAGVPGAAGAGGHADLAADLARLTAAWCAAEPRPAATAAGPAEPSARPPVRATLHAWASHDPAEFTAAARLWDTVMVRERVRCLLAAGQAGGGVPCLEQAERDADRAGLVLLAGRARRELRRLGVRRASRATAGPAGLSAREHETLALVGQGHSTRRIAELLGLTRNTTETYIKQAMAKLGARTRTEAAVRAAALAATGPPPAGAPVHSER